MSKVCAYCNKNYAKLREIIYHHVDGITEVDFVMCHSTCKSYQEQMMKLMRDVDGLKVQIANKYNEMISIREKMRAKQKFVPPLSFLDHEDLL
jgi:hypothetical protein